MCVESVDTPSLTRLCPEVIAALQEYIAAWGVRFRQDGGIPLNGAGAVTG